MSEKPQEARADEREDLLEQIISQGLEKIKAPVQAADEPEAPPEAASSPPEPESGERAVPLRDRKSRRSAVYLYLLVLFGAAFLMLLLAYFVQQRSSESAISYLQDSMNLSREQLLTEIRDLEAQNMALSEELAQWQTRYEEKDGEATDLWNKNYDMQGELYSWASFWMLEEFYHMGNYETCAAVLLFQLQSGEYSYRAPDAARQAEIARAVIDAGILGEDYAEHPENYLDLLDAYSKP